MIQLAADDADVVEIEREAGAHPGFRAADEVVEFAFGGVGGELLDRALFRSAVVFLTRANSRPAHTSGHAKYDIFFCIIFFHCCWFRNQRTDENRRVCWRIGSTSMPEEKPVPKLDTSDRTPCIGRREIIIQRYADAQAFDIGNR